MSILQMAKHILAKAKCHIVSPLRKSAVKRHTWTYDEERALVEFVTIARTDPKYGLESLTEWPSYREAHCFWTDAALHIKTSTSSNILLTSMFFIVFHLTIVLIISKDHKMMLCCGTRACTRSLILSLMVTLGPLITKYTMHSGFCLFFLPNDYFHSCIYLIFL